MNMKTYNKPITKSLLLRMKLMQEIMSKFDEVGDEQLGNSYQFEDDAFSPKPTSVWDK